MPFQWDFTGTEEWRFTALPSAAPELLFDAVRDLDTVLYPSFWQYVRFETDVVPGSQPDRLALSATVQDFRPSPHHFALRTFLPDDRRARLVSPRTRAALAEGELVVRARSTGGTTGRMTVALVFRDGSARGATLELGPAWEDHRVALSDLEAVPLALLPRPYPQFLPYFFEGEVESESENDGAGGGDGTRVDPGELDGLQFSMDAALFGPADGSGVAPRGFQVERVELVPGEG